MADITLGYTPVDGDALDVNGLNADLYDTTPSVSLYETANGHIELANFDPSFRVQSWHVQPGETNLSGFAGQVFSADYFQDAWGQGEVFKPVAGCCLTFYQRYDAGLANLFASLSCTTWRQPGPIGVAAESWTASPNILVRMFVDGVAVDSTMRPLPQTVFYGTGAWPTVAVHTVEARTTRHFNLFVPKVAGGTAPHGALTAGWHSFGLAVYVAANTEGSHTSDTNDTKRPSMNGAGTDARPQAWYHAMHRVRCYVRNAGWASFL